VVTGATKTIAMISSDGGSPEEFSVVEVKPNEIIISS